MEHPRPTHNQANSRSSGEISICTRRIAGSLLISEPDEPDSQIDCFLRNLNHGYSDDAEENCDTKVTESARNDLSTCWRRHDGEDCRAIKLGSCM